MIQLVNVSKYYNQNNAVALGLRKVNLELHANEFVAIVGESGSGKTTLLNVICGIDTYEEGEIFFNGEATSYFSTSDLEDFRKQYVAFVFQNYNLIDSYTVLQNVEAPMVLAGLPKKLIRERALSIIERVGLSDHIHHKATKLSGGQKQRVVIARALAKDCPIIAADEPTGNLDQESGKAILQLLHEIAQEKLVILVTHDYEQVKQYATRKIRMYDGEVVEDKEVKKTEPKAIPTKTEKDKPLSFLKTLAIAWRNLMSVPKKTLLAVVVFTFFTFFVALSYGGYLLASSTAGEINNAYFSNTSDRRVVIRKTDLSALSTDDLNQLKSLNRVSSLVVNDYILDIEVNYQGNLSVDSDYNYLSVKYWPVSALSETDLIAGRMPTSDTEVVFVSDSISQEDINLMLNITYQKNNDLYYGFETSQFTDLTVVGVVKSSKLGLDDSPNRPNMGYFLVSDDVLSQYSKDSFPMVITNLRLAGTNSNSGQFDASNVMSAPRVVIKSSLPDRNIVLSKSLSYNVCMTTVSCTATGLISIQDYYQTTELTNVSFSISSGDDYNVLEMNQATYDALFHYEVRQVSLVVDSDLFVAALMAQVSLIPGTGTSKYHVFYPHAAQSLDPFSQLFLVMTLLGSTLLLVFTLFASTLISFLILKAITNTKLKDYAIFRTVGANRKVITQLIYMENIIASTIAYVILVGIIELMKSGPVWMNEIVRYYQLGSYIILFIIMFVMGYFVSMRYCQRVFRESVQRTLKSE